MKYINGQISNRSKIPNSVYISARNDLIHFIRKNIFIRIEKLNRIRIVVNDREFSNNINPWNGNYEKINSSYTESAEKDNESAEEIKLEGIFTGINDTITFNGSEFTQKGSDFVKSGIFSVFNYNGQNIIELRYLDSNRLVGEKKEYSIDYRAVQY